MNKEGAEDYKGYLTLKMVNQWTALACKRTTTPTSGWRLAQW